MGHEDAELVGPEELSPAGELWETVWNTPQTYPSRAQPSARQPLFTALGPLLLEDSQGRGCGPFQSALPGWNARLWLEKKALSC